MRLISPTGPKVTRKSDRIEGKEEGEKKKPEHSYVFISSTLEILNDKKPLLSKSYSLANNDGQQRTYPRAEVISIVFINPGRYVYISSESTQC